MMTGHGEVEALKKDKHNLAQYDHPTLVKRYNECIDDYRRVSQENKELQLKINLLESRLESIRTIANLGSNQD